MLQIKEKCLFSIKKVTVEPTMFLTVCTSIMYQLITQNLYLEKSCRVDWGFNKKICDGMTKRNSSQYTIEEETQVQKLVSDMLAIRTSIEGIFPVILILFIGSWIDRNNRRKTVILLPIIGEIICCLLLIINNIFFYQLPIIITTISESLPLAIFGGWPCFFLGIYSFIGKYTTTEERTLRVGIVSASQMGGYAFGITLSGIILQQLGFIGFYTLSVVLLSIGLTFGNFLIKEEQIGKIIMSDFFSTKNIKDTLKVCFKEGKNNKKLKIIIIIILNVVVNGTMKGELNVFYMFTRYKYGWNPLTYSVFYSSKFFLHIFGIILALILTRKFNFEDATLGIFSMCGAIISRIIFALAPSEVFLYLGAICDIFHIGGPVALRSLLSKIVKKNELGQSYAVLGIFEAALPTIFGPIYTMLYKYTIESLPEMFFYLTASIKVIGLILFLWLYNQTRVEKENESDKEIHISTISIND